MKRIGVLLFSVLLLVCSLWPGGGHSRNVPTMESTGGNAPRTSRLALDNRILEGIDRYAITEISAKHGIKATFGEHLCLFEPGDAEPVNTGPGQRILPALLEILLEGRELPGAIAISADRMEISIYCPNAGPLPEDFGELADALKLACTSARAFDGTLQRGEMPKVTLYRKLPPGSFFGQLTAPTAPAQSSM